MRKFLITALSGLFLSYTAVEAYAGDNVYVDLSVLNDVGTSPAPSYAPTYAPTFAPSYVPDYVRTEPKFPIVQKKAVRTAPKKVVKPAVAKKPVKKTTPAAKPVKHQLKIKQISIKDKEEKINIPSKPADIMSEPAVSDTAVELKAAPAEREFVAGVAEKMPVDNGPFQAEVKAPAEKISSAPIVPVASETMDVIEVKEASSATETLSTIEAPSATVSPLPAEPKTPVTRLLPEANEPAEAEVKPLLPVNPSSVDIAAVKREVIFAEGSDELNETAKEKIDEIVAAFENPKVNKIAILAYNFDNGQDVFRKKRQSLNRAIEIRSYLLAKGYKNFSIKVINITDDAPRGNVVEIDEIK